MNPERCVWFFSDSAHPKFIGGGETARRQWSLGIIDQGRKPVWYAPTVTPGESHSGQTLAIPPGVEVRNLQLKSFVPPQAAEVTRFVVEAARQKPDAIVFNGESHYSIPFLAALIVSGQMERIVQVFHNPPIIQIGQRVEKERQMREPTEKTACKPLWKRGLAKSGRIFANVIYRHFPFRKIAVSSWVKEKLADVGINKRVKVVYPPIYSEHDCRPSERHFNEAGLSVLTTSRFTPEKGLEFLIELAKTSRCLGLPVIYSLVGPRLINDQYREKIESQASGVVNVYDAKVNGDLCRLYEQADVILTPRPDEAFGLSGVEGMYHGAVSLSRSPVTQEIYDHFSQPPGVVVNTGNFDSDLSGCLSHLTHWLNHPALLRSLSFAALEARNIFDPKKISGEFAKYVVSS